MDKSLVFWMLTAAKRLHLMKQMPNGSKKSLDWFIKNLKTLKDSWYICDQIIQK
jgi:hypothetical protein